MPIADSEIASVLAAYLDRYPGERALLAEPIEFLARGKDFSSRRSFPMHVTVGALLTRCGEEVLLVGHRAYGITLQPGGHLEPTDTTLGRGQLWCTCRTPASIPRRRAGRARRGQ